MRLLSFRNRTYDLSHACGVLSQKVRSFSVAMDSPSVSIDGQHSKTAFQRFLQNESDIKSLNNGVSYFGRNIHYLDSLKIHMVKNLPVGALSKLYLDRSDSIKTELAEKMSFDHIQDWINTAEKPNIVHSFSEFLNTFSEDRRQVLTEGVFSLLSQRSRLEIDQSRSSSSYVQLTSLKIVVKLYLEYNFHKKRSFDSTPYKEERNIAEIYEENYYLNDILNLFKYSGQYKHAIFFFEILNEKYEINLDLETCSRLIFICGHTKDYDRIISIFNEGHSICDNIEVTDFKLKKEYENHLHHEHLFYSSVAHILLKARKSKYETIGIQSFQILLAKGFVPDVKLLSTVLKVCYKAGIVGLAYDVIKLYPANVTEAKSYVSILWAIQNNWKNLFNNRFLESFYERKDSSKILDLVETTSFASIINILPTNFEQDHIIVDEQYKNRIKKRLSPILDNPLEKEIFYEVCSRLNVDIDAAEINKKVDELHEYMQSILEDSKPYSSESNYFNMILLPIANMYISMNNFEYFEDFVNKYSVLDITSDLTSTLISVYYYANKGNSLKIEQLMSSEVFHSKIIYSNHSSISQVLLALASMKNEVGFDALAKCLEVFSTDSTFKLKKFVLVNIERSYLDSGLLHPIGDIIENWQLQLFTPTEDRR